MTVNPLDEVTASSETAASDLPRPALGPRRWACVAAAVLLALAALLGADVLAGTPYILPVLLLARCGRPMDVSVAALAGTALILYEAFTPGEGVPLSSALPPRVPAIISIWLVVGFNRHLRRSSDTLRHARRRYHDLMENSPDGILVLNHRGIIEHANPRLEEITGYPAHELTGSTVERLVPARYSNHHNFIHAYLRNPTRRYMGSGSELPLRCRDGREIQVEIALAHSGRGSDVQVFATIRDVSERKRFERALIESERRLRDIANTIPGAVYQFVASADGRRCFNFISDGIATLIGSRPTAASTTLEELLALVVADDLDPLLASIEASIAAEQVWNHEFRVRSPAGETKWVRGSAVPTGSGSTGNAEWNGILLDVTEGRQLADRLSYQAAHDGLTGLYNRQSFEHELNAMLSGPAGHVAESVLAYLDLDQFKVVNDTCGHSAGDELLRQLATLLKDSLRDSDLVARLGGDEFAVLMRGSAMDKAHAVMDRIREALCGWPFVWDGKTFNVGVSIGLVEIGPENIDLVEVMRRADAACYAAKDRGRNCIHVFQAADHDLASQHGQVSWVPLINEALNGNHFELFAQPILGLSDADPHEHHCELLLRMRLSSGELVAPGRFLPAAERYNLASRIDRWVVKTALEWLAQLPESELAHRTFNINLSGLSIGDAETTAFIHDQLRMHAGLASAICFEITETAAISKLATAWSFIAGLKSLGCQFALDDFGSGISSFGQLKNLDVDFVKIDGIFVRDIARDPIDRAMVTAINQMAHAMGIRTVAEFVEDGQILQLLKQIGVDFAQGYAIGPPVPIADIGRSPPARH